MKKLLLITLMVVFLAVPAFAATVTFTWEHSDPAAVDGFRLYQRTGPEYDTVVWEGKELTCTIEFLVDTEYAYVVRAFKTMPLSGDVVESADSNEVFYVPAIEPPKNLILKAIDQLIVGLTTLREALE
jgi:hypothetical protein